MSGLQRRLRSSLALEPLASVLWTAIFVEFWNLCSALPARESWIHVNLWTNTKRADMHFLRTGRSERLFLESALNG